MDNVQTSTAPHIDIFPEFPKDGGLRRSSTFRAYLEKAANDINNKYDTSSNLPPNKQLDQVHEEYLPPDQTLASAHGMATTYVPEIQEIDTEAESGQNEMHHKLDTHETSSPICGDSRCQVTPSKGVSTADKESTVRFHKTGSHVHFGYRLYPKAHCQNLSIAHPEAKTEDGSIEASEYSSAAKESILPDEDERVQRFDEKEETLLSGVLEEPSARIEGNPILVEEEPTTNLRSSSGSHNISQIASSEQIIEPFITLKGSTSTVDLPVATKTSTHCKEESDDHRFEISLNDFRQPPRLCKGSVEDTTSFSEAETIANLGEGSWVGIQGDQQAVDILSVESRFANLAQDDDISILSIDAPYTGNSKMQNVVFSMRQQKSVKQLEEIRWASCDRD